MEQISGADLLAIRSQAAMADDYTTISRKNTDRLTQAYLALQVENVNLRDLIRAHVESSNNDDTAGDTFAALMAVAHNAELCGGTSATNAQLSGNLTGEK